MFRGKSATNGEGQTGGVPFNHLGVAAEEQNRTDKGADMSKKICGFTSRKWLCFFTGLLVGVVLGGLA